MNIVNHGFELGPIRPPSEANSMLLRITRNCPWNKCVFCPVYKKAKFSFRSIEEIKSDIDSMHYIINRIHEKESELGKTAYFQDIKLDVPEDFIRKAMYWKTYGMKNLFLQDADSLVMKTPQLLEVLRYVKEKFPSLERITTYARAKTVSRKSLEELVALKNAGLTRIHIGLESGSDTVLEILKKGVTSEEQIEAGRKAIAAGFELSEYYMPGAGGKEFIEENALESARVLSSINPTYIRLRSTVPIPGTPLFELMNEKGWTQASEEDKIREIKLFVENLHGLTSIIQSDHIMNLIEDVEGTLPDDKEKIIGILDSFLEMNQDEKESYIIARRLGRVRYLSDYRENSEIIAIKKYLKERYATIDDAVSEILRNYI